MKTEEAQEILTLGSINPKEYEIEKYLLIPTNDNLRRVLPDILKDMSLDGNGMWPVVKNMFSKKQYRRRAGNTMLWIKSAEQIPKEIIGYADENYMGITGSDLLITEIYRRPSFELWDGNMYKNPREILPQGPLPVGYEFYFESDDKIVKAKVLKHEPGPRMVILGPDDQTYEEVIEKRNKGDKPLTVVVEKRFEPIAKALFENEKQEKGFEYKLIAVDRTSEGYVRHGGEPEIDNIYDVCVEIGETFRTARANKLDIYLLNPKEEEIMFTAPVQIRCYRSKVWVGEYG